MVDEQCQCHFSEAKAAKANFSQDLVLRLNGRDCESVSVSKYSEGPVLDEEFVATCRLNPTHYDSETGRLTHKLVSKAFGSGLSVSRLKYAEDHEVEALCERIAAGRNKPRKPVNSSGWLKAEAGQIRALMDDEGLLYHVFDTGREDDKAHADIIARRHFGNDPATKVKAEAAAVKLLTLFLESDPEARTTPASIDV